MAKKYDDFDEEDQGGVFDQVSGIISTHKRSFAIASVVVALVLLGVVVFGSYPENENAAGESVPIVRADAGEYKVVPENPGGMEIPYRDSTVFSSDEQKPETEGTENILADEGSEQPIPKEQLFAGLNTEGDQPGGAPVTETPDTAVAEPTATDDVIAKVEPVEPPSNDALVKEAIGVPPSEETKTASATLPAEAMKAAPVEETKVPVKEEIKKAEIVPAPKSNDDVVAKTEPAAGSTTAKAVSPGNYYVQLASVKSTAGATTEFKKLQVKYPGLSGLKYRTQEANLGAKGTFYRIQAGPMSKESATKICMDIKAKGGSCLVAGK